MLCHWNVNTVIIVQFYHNIIYQNTQKLHFQKYIVESTLQVTFLLQHICTYLYITYYWLHFLSALFCLITTELSRLPRLERVSRGSLVKLVTSFHKEVSDGITSARNCLVTADHSTMLRRWDALIFGKCWLLNTTFPPPNVYSFLLLIISHGGLMYVIN